MRLLFWSAAIRVGHWLLAGSVLACLALYEGGSWHERAGWLALAVAAWRVLWGACGPRADRFSAFVRSPRATWRYARLWLRAREPHPLGHNPLGAWMIVALLAAALVAGASGALYATDALWGDERVYAWHRIAGWSFALLVPLHLAGIVVASLRSRQNLVRAMVDGRKAPARDSL